MSSLVKFVAICLRYKINILIFVRICFRHERKQHPGFVPDSSESTTCSTSVTTTNKSKEDYLYNYHQAKLAFGLLLMQFEDAIKEGDGNRVNNVYKFALLLYKCYGHHKYAYVTLLYLVRVQKENTEMEGYSMKWNRFYSKYGGKGRNISLDLKMEQLNKILKSMFKSLGANVDERNAERVANAIQSVDALMESVDKDCSLSQKQGRASKGKPEETVEQIVKDLADKTVFQHTPSREGHPSFKKFESNLLKDLDYRDLHKWMTEHLKKWKYLNEK